MRKICFSFIISFLCLSSLKSDPVKIERTENSLSVSWKTPHGYSFRSVKDEDKESTLSLFQNAEFKEGLPSNLENWWTNQHLARTSGPVTNAYHLYGVQNELGELIAAVHFGRMPVFGYNANTTYSPEEHKEILAHWVQMGVARQKEETGGYEYVNLERAGGIATLMPVFTSGIHTDRQREILEDASALVSELSLKGELLPAERRVDAAEVESVKPTWVLNLISPEDPLRNIYTSAGFAVVEGEWVQKFYNKPRLIVQKKLTD